MGKLKLGVIILVSFFIGVGVGAAGSSSGSSTTGVQPVNKQSTTQSNTEAVTSQPTVQADAGKIEVKSHKNKTEYGYPKVVGEVINNTQKPASFVKVTATYYNASGEVVGTGYTYAGDTSSTPLQPNSTTPFEITDTGKTTYDNYKLDVTWQ